jgi:hypothetical protein
VTLAMLQKEHAPALGLAGPITHIHVGLVSAAAEWGLQQAVWDVEVLHALQAMDRMRCHCRLLPNHAKNSAHTDCSGAVSMSWHALGGFARLFKVYGCKEERTFC